MAMKTGTVNLVKKSTGDIVKGVEMYHAIVVLRESGKSIREIAEILKISKTTVQNYTKLTQKSAKEKYFPPSQKSVLQPFETEFSELIGKNHKLRASKLFRDFKRDHPEIEISSRTFRDFIRKIKQETAPNKIRYFSVIDHKPGIQMQVDPGEMLLQTFYNEKFKVYFVVFIFCFSRKKYVYFQERPFKTQDFINAHISCFRFFGYIPSEMIYDQTKLVVISEKYREVCFNSLFYQFISGHEISPFVCEGYDPQSKGLVENAVKEVKHDFLAGENFLDIAELRKKSLCWLSKVNNRIHSTLRVTPETLFEDEKKLLRPFHYESYEERKVDKTGLISWKSNKYSVPYEYQRKEVLVHPVDGTLKILDCDSKAEVASHRISKEKVSPRINKNHYRDYSKILKELKLELILLLTPYKNHIIFVDRLIAENMRNPRDQVRAIISFHKKHPAFDWNEIISKSLNFGTLRASKVEEIIELICRADKLKKIKDEPSQEAEKPVNSELERDLSLYDNLKGLL